MPDQSFVFQCLLFMAVASGVLSNISVIVVSLRGKPTVRKDEFDEHKTHVSARFSGVNKKVDDLEAEVRGGLTNITASLGETAQDFQRGLGKLEGAVEAILSRLRTK